MAAEGEAAAAAEMARMAAGAPPEKPVKRTGVEVASAALAALAAAEFKGKQLAEQLAVAKAAARGSRRKVAYLDLAHPGTRSISTAPARISCRTLMLGCSPHPLIHTLVASGGDGHGSW